MSAFSGGGVAAPRLSTEAFDDAELLCQLVDVIGETSQCLDALVARRASLESCIRLTEDLHRHLHAAHSTVAQRLSFLGMQVQNANAGQQGLPSQGDRDAPRCAARATLKGRVSFTHSGGVHRLAIALLTFDRLRLVPVRSLRSEPERLIAEAKALSERLQAEMMPSPPPQIGSAAAGSSYLRAAAPDVRASQMLSLSTTHATKAITSRSSQPLPAATHDVPFLLQGVLSIGAESSTELSSLHTEVGISAESTAAPSATVAVTTVTSAAGADAYFATSQTLPTAESVSDANGGHASATVGDSDADNAALRVKEHDASVDATEGEAEGCKTAPLSAPGGGPSTSSWARAGRRRSDEQGHEQDTGAGGSP